MCVLWILLDDFVKVFNSLFIHINHLVSFCSLVDVANVGRKSFDASAVRKNTFFKLLLTAIAQPDMIVDVGDVGYIRTIV